MNTNSGNAKTALELLIKDAQELLLSPQEASQRLDKLAATLFARRLQVQIDQFGEKYIWGALDGAAPTQVLQRGELSTDVQFRVLGDYYPETAEEQGLLPCLKELVRALWGDDMRPAGGLVWKRESVRVRLPKSVERLREQPSGNGSIAVLYGDLDNFKNLNDQAGHERGDEAIRMVNRELHDLCLRYGGLPFHPSGDEYYLILPNVGLLPMMRALYDLRQRIREYAFKDADGRSHNIDLTLGLQFLREEVTFDRVGKAITEAEEATKSPPTTTGLLEDASRADGRDKNKRRGRLSIASVAETSSGTTSAYHFARFGAVMVRRRSCLSRSTFPDPRLGMMELVAQKNGVAVKPEALGDAVEDLRKWLDIETTDECSMGSLLQEQPTRAIPKIAVALAVASGILRAKHKVDQALPSDLRVVFSANGSHAHVLHDGDVIWGDRNEDDCALDQAEIVTKQQTRESVPLIGLQVGLSDRPKFGCGSELPRDMFSAVVVIDDRPNSGGGLPDFWQVAVAQVYQSAAVGTGESYVFAWGKTRESSETIRRLRQDADSSINIDEISSLADIKSDAVRTLQPILMRNLRLIESAEQLVESLYDIAPVEVMEPSDEPTKGHAKSDILRRKMLDSQGLGAIDGVRCRTAAQAYPIVIDVLRREAVRESADDAFQALRELIAFKLVIETPQQDPVPAYLQDQREDMRRYADEVLLKPQSRIGKVLEDSGQVNAFNKELKGCYDAGAQHRSTRRAILVVPHAPKTDGFPSPEGLVSIWASPRVGEGSEGDIVDWVFVWRTVEAFIGLPYSLYGSIRLAQELLSRIVQTGTEAGAQLRMGQLTYVALSLHMRVDGVHHRIAKRIVDLSSD